MKKITANRIALVISVLFVIALTSCTKDESAVKSTDKSNSEGLIRVTGENAGSALKTALSDNSTLWIAAADKVGIYSPEALTEGGGVGFHILNAEFTAASSGAYSDFTGTMFWGSGSTLHHFYSYYPYAAGTPAGTVVPVSLASAQTQSAANISSHIGLLDFMVATPVALTSPYNTDQVGNALNLKYNHLFTILEFQIRGSGTLKALKLVGTSNALAFSGGTIDITQATPASGTAYTVNSMTGTTKEVVVTLTNAATLTAVNTDTKVYMVINPGTQTGNCDIGLSADGSTWTYINKAAPVGGFLRGAKYVVSINSADADDAPSYPETGTPAVLIAGRWWAPVNLGYATDPKGLLFQWHRKYGQTYGGAVTLVPGPVDLATGNDPANANTFFARDAADWCTTSEPSWNMSSAYNPCPAGWRVPTNAELQALQAAGSTWQSTAGSEGRWFGGNHSGDHVGSIFIPAAGTRYDGGSTLAYRGQLGWCWSTGAGSTYRSYRLGFDSSGVYFGIDPRGFGFSVRCVQ